MNNNKLSDKKCKSVNEILVEKQKRSEYAQRKYNSPDRLKSPQQIAEFIISKELRGKYKDDAALIFKFVEFIISETAKNPFKPIRYPLNYLAKLFDRAPEYISNITSELRRLGIIRKISHGHKAVMEYRLTKMMRDQKMQPFLLDIFPWLKIFAFSFFCYTGTLLNFQARALQWDDLNHIITRTIYLNIKKNPFKKRSINGNDYSKFSTNDPPTYNKINIAPNLAQKTADLQRFADGRSSFKPERSERGSCNGVENPTPGKDAYKINNLLTNLGFAVKNETAEVRPNEHSHLSGAQEIANILKISEKKRPEKYEMK